MVDLEHSDIWRGGRLTRVQAFPISIDFDRHVQEAEGSAVESHVKRWRAELGGRCECLGIGIDRADYTKGIPDRLRAVDRTLELYPEYRGKLTFLQVAVPSRTHIETYRRLNEEIETVARDINRRWGNGTWQPIYLCRRNLPQAELMALHRLAAFCMVTSLHDGMNLVAKEFVASRIDGDGVLILSSFTGAARELTSAVQVNPFSVDQMADAIQRALTMPHSERSQRMRALRRTVEENNVYAWAVDIMRSLLEMERSNGSVRTEQPLAAASVL